MNADSPSDGVDQAQERRRALRDDLAVAREEHSAELVEAAVEAQKRGFAALMSGLDFVEKFDATDPMRGRLIDAFKQRMLRISAALSKAEEPQGRVAETLNDPFSGKSVNSSTGSPEPSTPSKPLAGSQRPSLPEPEKRGRGRPPGVKNKPKPDR